MQTVANSMKSQILFPGKNMKKISKMLSAENFTQNAGTEYPNNYFSDFFLTNLVGTH